MMKLPNKGSVKIDADLGDLDVILHFLVCFLRVSTSSPRPNSDDGMFLRRNLLVTYHYTFLYKKCHLAPFTSDAWGGGPRADHQINLEEHRQKSTSLNK